MTEPYWSWSAAEISAAVRSRSVSATTIVESALRRVEKLNPSLCAMTDFLPESALADAARIDTEVASGNPVGKLAGVPVTIKENVDFGGLPTTHGVSALADTAAPGDCSPLMFWRQAGAIPIGRSNTADFGLRWHTESELHGATKNPWDPARTPGGSSGGAAVAVASGMGALAHGNDFGGSLRYPAQACGVTALKPTAMRVACFNPSARVERPPAIQLMAVQGLMARNVADLQAGFECMALPDPRDPWQLALGQPARLPVAAKQVGLCRDPGGMGVDPAIARHLDLAAAHLEKAGYQVDEIELPDVEEAIETWLKMVAIEVRSSDWEFVRRTAAPATVRSFELLSAGIDQLDHRAFLNCFSSRTKLMRHWSMLQQDYPLVLTPASAQQPFPVGADLESESRSRELLIANRMLVYVNLLGLPAVCLCAGYEDGLPQGVQIIGPRFGESACLAAAKNIESAVGPARLVSGESDLCRGSLPGSGERPQRPA